MTTKKETQKIFKEFTEPVSTIDSKLQDLISNHEYCKNSYFWSPQSTASQRRAKETQFSRYVEFELETGKLVVEQTMRQSCKHVYYDMKISAIGFDKKPHEKFGTYKYNLTTLKQLSSLVLESTDTDMGELILA